MANERLRAALLERGITTGALAAAIDVDEKTVERWITKGRTPYRQHRYAVASHLKLDEGYLWPEALSGEQIDDAMAAKVRGVIRMYRPLSETEGAEIRLHDTVLYNSIYRADEQFLINMHVYGVPASNAPFMHLRRVAGGDMANMYETSFERVWEGARLLAGD